jgi:Sigma-70, region 4
MNTNSYLRLLLMVLAHASTKFGQIVGDKDRPTPFALLRGKNLHHALSGLLEVLDDREREIIFQRFGLDGGKSKTLEEVGKNFGVTRERIRQLQNIALAKLRSRIQSDPALHRIPVVFVTGLVTKAEAKSGLRIKGHLFLAKPITFPELIQDIEEIYPRVQRSESCHWEKPRNEKNQIMRPESDGKRNPSKTKIYPMDQWLRLRCDRHGHLITGAIEVDPSAFDFDAGLIRTPEGAACQPTTG